MIYKFFDKKLAGSGTTSTPTQQLTDKRHKPIIRKFKSLFFF